MTERSYKPYKATEIANFLIYVMSDSCEDLTNMKLNKILYYAQGHHLQREKTPLFEEPIEAWKHGPVVRTVYNTYKKFSEKPITEYNVDEISVIDDDVKSYLVDIARVYGRYTASTLRNMTHRPKSPWSEVDEGEFITNDAILRYFEKNEPEIKPLEMVYTDEDYIGHRDQDGLLVLPKGWQDEEI